MPYPKPHSSHPSTQILLSLTTAPFLVGLIVSKVLAEFIKDMGQATEEVFRGDRLPVLRISSFTRSDSEDQ